MENILGININISGSGNGKIAYDKIKDKELFRRRASMEPIIGYNKQDHQISRNYLKSVEGDMINTLLAGEVFNIMRML